MSDDIGATSIRGVESGSVAGSDRREFLKKAGVGAAAAWTAPVLLSTSAHAQGTDPQTPDFVAGSGATDYAGESSSQRSITLTSSAVAEGDLWLAIVAYDRRGNINLPSGAGWSSTGPIDAGETPFLEPNYTVRAYVVWRVLTAADAAGGTFAATFTSTTTNLVHGGLRGSAVAYRGVNLTAAVTPDSGMGPVASNIVTATFPATGSPPPENVVVRLGAARGYGGWNALDPSINWETWPGTLRVNFNDDNNGDRALVISEQVDGNGAAANGTYYRQSSTAFSDNNRAWAVATVLITST